ncbi:MAG: helix-turn-helix transcriptional regulator [Gammaproteobacteria bacterium]|jgi:DNA-binding CsgD family transcriptional regulator
MLLNLISTKLKFHLCKLSKRESECVCCILRGMTTRQMANMMDLSPRTVEGYLLNIKNKLDCKDRYEIISKVLGNDFPWEELFLLPSAE